MQSFAASQRNLRTDHLDALLLHSPLGGDSETLVAWRAFEEIAATGGARRLGISNCYRVATLQALHASARIKPTIVQNRFHAAERYDRTIRAFCDAHGLTYQSFWTLTANARVLAQAQVLRLAERHGRTAAQILFRYLTQIGVVPLIGTRSLAHMREDLAIFEFELSDDERAALDVLF